MNNLLTQYRFIPLALILCNQTCIVSIVQADSFDSNEFSLELDELLATDVQVTSAMKRLQNMSDTAASIYVLSNKEIIKSGVSSVAEALKLIPGMQVRQIDNNQWAITSRSSAGRYSSKLLVMVDGQSIYNPGFAGVYWEALNIPLYDIDRIEVIRGQGGLLWGSNATNGVVNIISKHTSDTRNVFTEVETGSQVDARANFRVGGNLGHYSSFRIFGGLEKTDESSQSSQSIVANDEGEKKNIGGRVDLNINENTSLFAQTQYTHIELGQDLKVPDLQTYQKIYVEDQYARDHLQVMARLDNRVSIDSNQMFQASISSQKGDQLFYQDEFLIADIDYQMNTLIKNIQFDWGMNYRYNDISVEDTAYIKSIENIDSYNHYGGFMQVQFNLIPDKLKLILGNRSEKNSFTGWEHQPMLRLLWNPESKHNIWGAISQGVRIPSLIEYNGLALGASSQPVKAVITGSDEIEAEKSVSKEVGYRYNENIWGLDVSLFHTKARNALVVEKQIDLTLGQYSINLVSDAELITYGGEAILKWHPYEGLIAEFGYSFTSYEYDLPDGTDNALGFDSYLRQIIAKASYSITKNHSIYALYRIENGDGYKTDDFSVLDLNWNWEVSPSATLSISGKNLLFGKHLEYNNTSETYTVATYIEPSLLARLTMKF
jgi:iron complex outermembrane receptor protein